MKKVIYTLFITLTVLLSTGCSSSGNPEITAMNKADIFEVGKTTISDVEARLGGTHFMFDKEDGVKKYVYTGGKHGMFYSGKNRTHVLFFDKNRVLTSQELITKRNYVDPDIANMGASLMQAYRNGQYQ